MPSTGETKKEQKRAYDKTPKALAVRAAYQVKYRAAQKNGGVDAIPSLKIDPQALLAALSNWKQA